MKRISVLFLLSVILTALMLPLEAVNLDVSVSAHHAAVYEPTTGVFLYEKNGDERAPMASTTKIMTALIAIENADPDSTVTVPKEACGVEGSSVYLRAGEKLTLKDLLYALLLQSANDAAAAIAIHVAGSVPAFADLMNARAEKLGLHDTHFVNPHGLDDPAHYTTAKDLALITAEAMEHPLFAAIVATYKHTIPSPDGKERVLVNHNKLLRLYDDATGVKTGFTKKSGRCLVGAAEHAGLSFITVTLDAPNDWNDHIKLFENAFATLENRCLFEAGAFRAELPLIGTDKTVTLTNEEPIYAILPTGAQSPEAVLDLPHFLTSSAAEGQAVGCVRFTLRNHTVAESTLVVASP